MVSGAISGWRTMERAAIHACKPVVEFLSKVEDPQEFEIRPVRDAEGLSYRLDEAVSDTIWEAMYRAESALYALVLRYGLPEGNDLSEACRLVGPRLGHALLGQSVFLLPPTDQPPPKHPIASLLTREARVSDDMHRHHPPKVLRLFLATQKARFAMVAVGHALLAEKPLSDFAQTVHTHTLFSGHRAFFRLAAVAGYTISEEIVPHAYRFDAKAEYASWRSTLEHIDALPLNTPLKQETS